jgi:peptide/nickel transport system permease protein
LKSAFNRSVLAGSVILAVIFLIGLTAPFLGTRDPSEIDPISRNKRPGAVRVLTGADGQQRSTTYWMGTDSLGRDIYSRVLYGARVSMLVGISVALISIAAGLVIGLLAGYIRWLDGFVMRIMDGLMAVPAILLAIALVSLSTAGLRAVILAIVIPEVPRVVRLVRSVVLSIREEPYVEAAIALGARTVPLIVGHVLPNALAPLIVQATYVCASAIVNRGHPVLPGRGHPTANADVGQHHGGGTLALPRLPAQHSLPGDLLGRDGAGGQYHGRRPARQPRSAAAQPPLKWPSS